MLEEDEVMLEFGLQNKEISNKESNLFNFLKNVILENV